VAGSRAPRARLTAVRRFLLLIGLGIVLDSAPAVLGILTLSEWPRWGVLQTLGLGGLLATAVSGLAGRGRGGARARLLPSLPRCTGRGAPLPARRAHLRAAHAGRPARGARARGGSPERQFVTRAAAAAVAGVGWSAAAQLAGVPFNKALGTSSFVAIATAASAALLLATAALERAGVAFPDWLVAVGANALTAWVLQYLLVYYPAWLVFWGGGASRSCPGMAAVVAALRGALRAQHRARAAGHPHPHLTGRPLRAARHWLPNPLTRQRTPMSEREHPAPRDVPRRGSCRVERRADGLRAARGLPRPLLPLSRAAACRSSWAAAARARARCSG